MVGKATKQSGPSPGTGSTQSQMTSGAQGSLSVITADKRIKGKIIVELPTGKNNYVARVAINPKLFIYQGYDDASLSTFYQSMGSDSDKIWTPKKKANQADAKGVTNKPTERRRLRNTNRILRRVHIILPELYPTDEIGGDNGIKGDGDNTKRKGSSEILLRIPNVVPLVSVGIFLFNLNKAAPKVDRRIIEYTGPSKSSTYAVPQTEQENTEYINRLATITEVS